MVFSRKKKHQKCGYKDAFKDALGITAFNWKLYAFCKYLWCKHAKPTYQYLVCNVRTYKGELSQFLPMFFMSMYVNHSNKTVNNYLFISGRLLNIHSILSKAFLILFVHSIWKGREELEWRTETNETHMGKLWQVAIRISRLNTESTQDTSMRFYEQSLYGCISQNLRPEETIVIFQFDLLLITLSW